MCEHRQIQGEVSFEGLSPVHTNPFSNEKGAVLLRFQKNLRPHLTFSYRFRPSTLQRRSREKPHGSVCSPFWILTMERSGHLSCLFDDVTVFRQHRFLRPHQKRAFSKSIVFKLLHSGERFRTAPFSMIAFGVVVWTIAVSGAKHLRFRFKTDKCGRGLSVDGALANFCFQTCHNIQENLYRFLDLRLGKVYTSPSQ